MYRVILYTILLILFVRAINRLWREVVAGMNGGAPPQGNTPAPQHGVQMVRDPICGTFVVPERAITLTRGRDVMHFCSTACRDQYAAGAHVPRAEAVHGRPA